MAELSDVLGEDSLRYVARITPVIRKKYSIDFEELLKEPANYADNPKIAEKIKSMEEDVDSFIDGQIASRRDDEKALQNNLAVIDQDSKKIVQAIKTKASIAQVPFVKPAFVDVSEREEIIIEGYDASIDQLVTRMINISDYIADLSTSYGDYTVGSWLFSGRSKYMISIRPPVSEIIVMNMARDEIKALLESIYAEFSVK